MVSEDSLERMANTEDKTKPDEKESYRLSEKQKVWIIVRVTTPPLFLNYR